MRQSGLTILEIMIVVAIFAILGALTVPYGARSYRHYSITVETKNIIGLMRKAQNYAMTNTLESNYGIYATPANITLFRGNSYATRDPLYDENYAVAGSVTVSPQTEIIFQRISGRPQSEASITLSNSEKSQTITLGPEGIIDW